MVDQKNQRTIQVWQGRNCAALGCCRVRVSQVRVDQGLGFIGFKVGVLGFTVSL